MTREQSAPTALRDVAADRAADQPSANAASIGTGDPTTALGWVLNRWPTLVAVAMSAPGFLGASSPETRKDLVEGLGGVFILLPLAYLVLAKLRKRPATWPVVIAGVALVMIVDTRTFDVVDPAVLLTAIAVLVLAWGIVDGQLAWDRMLQIQAVAVVGFGAVAFTTLALLTQRPDLAGYLVAGLWLAHGVWDLIYLHLDKVVARSFAEWCAVIDILIAVQLVWLISG